MDIRFISPGILRFVTGTPELAVRLDRTSHDESGDGVLLLCGRTLFLVERKLGAFEYRAQQADLSELQVISSDKKSAVIDWRGERRTWLWSLLDDNDAARLLAQLAAAPVVPVADAGATAEAEAVPATFDGTISYAVLFVAGLMYAAEAGGELPESQERMVRQLAPPEALRAGVAFYTDRGLGDFIALVSEKCTPEQKLSLLANQLEVMMVDGLFRRRERAFALDFATRIGIAGETFHQLEHFFILKNQYNSLFPADTTFAV